jgi:hypothetical protein
MPKGLSKFKKISIDKAKGAVSSSWYNAIKKNIREKSLCPNNTFESKSLFL